MPKDELFKEIKDADGLIVRSGTKVTEELIAAAEKLSRRPRRIGLDNVIRRRRDRRGIVVMNTRRGHVTTAEHDVDDLRHEPPHPAGDDVRQAGKWEKDKFMGVELFNKVLGIVGVGQIGSHLTKLAQGIGMRVIAMIPISRPIGQRRWAWKWSAFPSSFGGRTSFPFTRR